MKRLVATLAVLVAVVGAGFAVGGGNEAAFSPVGAIVGNFGNGQGGRFGCSATCGGIPCVVNGKLAFRLTPSGNGGLACNAADWLAPGGLFGGGLIKVSVNCGVLGGGPGVITPSGKTNYHCNTN